MTGLGEGLAFRTGEPDGMFTRGPEGAPDQDTGLLRTAGSVVGTVGYGMGL